MLPGLARRPAGKERHWPLAVQTRRAHQPVMKPGKSNPAPHLQAHHRGLGRLRLQAPVSQQGGQPRQGLHRDFSGSAPPAPARTDQTASLLPGLLAATRTGLTPASDAELTNTKTTTALRHGDTSRSAGRTKGQGQLDKSRNLEPYQNRFFTAGKSEKSADDRCEFPISANPFSWLCVSGQAAVRPRRPPSASAPSGSEGYSNVICRKTGSHWTNHSEDRHVTSALPCRLSPRTGVAWR
jgi:hypothetical protein